MLQMYYESVPAYILYVHFLVFVCALGAYDYEYMQYSGGEKTA